MVVIQECFGIYTQVWSCFKVNTQQIIAEVKKMKALESIKKKLWKFKFTVNQIYCTLYFLFYIKYIFYKIFFTLKLKKKKSKP